MRRPIYTDPALPLEQLVQYSLWRWDIEINHRDEKQLVGVGEARVGSADSVDRQPALAVASYAILLLAGERAFGPPGIILSRAKRAVAAAHPHRADGRKVRTGQGTVVGNANPARAEGKCHRKYTA